MNIGDIVYLKAKKLTKYGMYFEGAGEQEILLPESEQITKIEEGESYLVIIGYDNVNDEYFLSQRIDSYLLEKAEPGDLKKGQKVSAVIYAYTPLGMKAAINKKYIGVLYKNQIFRELKLGEKTTAFIKNIRDDGKIDLSLQRLGYTKVQGPTEDILKTLQESGGFLSLNDKSSPEEIQNKFHISKKVFKQAIGKLYKERKILIKKDGIQLV